MNKFATRLLFLKSKFIYEIKLYKRIVLKLNFIHKCKIFKSKRFTKINHSVFQTTILPHRFLFQTYSAQEVMHITVNVLRFA